MTTPPEARYRQVATRLREAIAAGDYAPGQALPSESVLAEQYGLNRTTINKAIRLLAVEGLVTVEHGRGTFVRPQRPVMHMSASYVTQVGDQIRASWRSEAERHGMMGTQTLSFVGDVEADDNVATLLEIDPGSTVTVRRRIMFLDEIPVQLADSYYPADLAHGTPLTEPAKLPGGTVVALERLGIQIGDFEERVTARNATPTEQRSLQLNDTGQVVMVLIRTTYAADGRPVEVSSAILAADRHQLIFRLPAHGGK